jgi:hypothetical protein
MRGRVHDRESLILSLVGAAALLPVFAPVSRLSPASVPQCVPGRKHKFSETFYICLCIFKMESKEENHTQRLMVASLTRTHVVESESAINIKAFHQIDQHLASQPTISIIRNEFKRIFRTYSILFSALPNQEIIGNGNINN